MATFRPVVVAVVVVVVSVVVVVVVVAGCLCRSVSTAIALVVLIVVVTTFAVVFSDGTVFIRFTRLKNLDNGIVRCLQSVIPETFCNFFRALFLIRSIRLDNTPVVRFPLIVPCPLSKVTPSF